MSQAGGAAGGGGGGFGNFLKTYGPSIGLGVLSTASPQVALGVRTGIGALGFFDERRRKKTLQEMLSKYYGPGAGEEATTPSNAGDPSFGGAPGKTSLELEREAARSQGTLGLGGGERGLAETMGQPEPSMTAGAELSPNKISELLAKRSQPTGPQRQSREQFLGSMVAAGGISPMEYERFLAGEEARKGAEARYAAGEAKDEARYQETRDYRASRDAVSDARYAEGKATDEERYEETLAYRGRQEDRADDAAARSAANMAADNARAERAAELAEERFALEKARWERGLRPDAREIASILNSVNSSLDSLKNRAWMNTQTGEDADNQAIQERIQSLTEMQNLLLSKLEGAIPSVGGGQMAGQSTGQGPPLALGHVPGSMPTAQPGRKRWNAASGQFE